MTKFEPSPVQYQLAYRDAGDYLITQVPWPGPFDLEVARQGMLKPSLTVFEVVVVLDTSIPSDGYRRAYEARELLQAGILTNPAIKVSVRSTSVTIRSALLRKTLSQMVTYYPSVNLQGDAIVLEEPYPLLAHHLKDLQTLQASQLEVSDEEAIEHVTLLLRFLRDSVYKSVIEEEEARHKRKMCTFRMLWFLFKPGTTVYFESSGKLSAYVVRSVEYDEAILSRSQRYFKHYELSIWNLDFDGRFVSRRAQSVTIPPFSGERPITSLQAFPCDFVDNDDGGTLREKLIEDGKRWFELLRGQQIHYQGDTLRTPRRKCDGLVYIDPTTYYNQNPLKTPDVCNVQDMGAGRANCTCAECHGFRPHPEATFRWKEYDVIDPSSTSNLDLQIENAKTSASEVSKHRYLICSRYLYGFDLRSRTWDCFDVAYCFPRTANIKVIDSLVMPTERLDLIKALVQKFSTSSSGGGPIKSWGADFIESKGEGQIFLLHGSPGVGKTYTAECIAEYTERPLLSLTCGDIGTDEVIMEERLVKWFRIAEKWGAVMLIDEADVYLERRQMTDLKRNSMASVFLRCIEYYRGILFLTTNRVGHFDDAFISRIHIIIRYDKLSDSDRRKIWTQFFDKLSDDRTDFMITGRARAYVLEDEVISKLEWNGREIRNAFQTAVALAEFRFSQKANKTKNDCPTLDQKDFEQVCAMTRQFKQYLKDVHGLDEEERAFGAKSRAAEGFRRTGPSQVSSQVDAPVKA